MKTVSDGWWPEPCTAHLRDCHSRSPLDQCAKRSPRSLPGTCRVRNLRPSSGCHLTSPIQQNGKASPLEGTPDTDESHGVAGVKSQACCLGWVASGNDNLSEPQTGPLQKFTFPLGLMGELQVSALSRAVHGTGLARINSLLQRPQERRKSTRKAVLGSTSCQTCSTRGGDKGGPPAKSRPKGGWRETGGRKLGPWGQQRRNH